MAEDFTEENEQQQESEENWSRTRSQQAHDFHGKLSKSAIPGDK